MSITQRNKHFRFTPRVEGLEERVTPSAQITAVSTAGSTGDAMIAVYKNFGAPKLLGVINFAPGFSVSNLSVATGDVNGDGFDDVVAGVGPGSNLPSLVRVFLGTGTTGAFNVQQITGINTNSSFDFLPFGTFTGGVSLAVGNVDPTNDVAADPMAMTPGRPVNEIIVGVGSGGLPLIRLFEFGDVTPFDQGFALAPTVFQATKGITLAAGDFDGDGYADIAVGFRDGPLVRIFDNQNANDPMTFLPPTTYTGFAFDSGAAAPDLLANFAFQASFFSTGFYVAAGDLTADGIADLVLGNIEGNSISAAVLLPTLYTQGAMGAPGTFNGIDTNNFKPILPVGLGTGAGLPVTVNSNSIITGQSYLTGSSPTATGATTQVPDNVALGYSQNIDFNNLMVNPFGTPLFDFGNPQNSGIPDFFRLGFMGGVNVG